MGELFQQAIDAKQAGKFKRSVRIMEQVVAEYPQYGVLWWYLGGGYLHDLKMPRKAIPAFRKAVQLNPKSERASLGLFHSLWNADRVGEALAEIKRFQTLSNWTCKEYLEIVDELADVVADKPRTRKKLKTRR
jgi:tetratricopeptide (TPR) repeat protein